MIGGKYGCTLISKFRIRRKSEVALIFEGKFYRLICTGTIIAYKRMI
jgi:hypothetical protein